jgi:hypothetical protein
MLLRSRSLTGLEVGTCHRALIDGYFINQLIVVDYYPNYSGGKLLGYNLNEFTYGNIATTIRIATSFIPPYINYTTSIYTQVSAS